MVLKLAVFGSGRGSNFDAILKAIKEKRIDAEIVVVVVNNQSAIMGTKATNSNIPVISISHKNIDRQVHESMILDKLQFYDQDLICLAGYMRILSSHFINEVRVPIINIHPSLLPSFPGMNAQKQAIDYGVKISGCTVHLVNEGVDAGRVLGQVCVPVETDDDEKSLSSRILEEEHKLYPEIINKIAIGQIIV